MEISPNKVEPTVTERGDEIVLRTVSEEEEMGIIPGWTKKEFEIVNMLLEKNGLCMISSSSSETLELIPSTSTSVSVETKSQKNLRAFKIF